MFLAALALLSLPQGFTTTDLSASPKALLQPVSVSDVELHDGFWLERVQANRASLAAGHRELTKNGAFRNFRIAAGMEEGEHSVYVYTDSDCYKWAEAACIELALRPDAELQTQLDEFIGWVEAAQMKDGYIMTQFQVKGIERWTRLDGWHELYCHGHLIQAGIAHKRATGSDRLLNIARKVADLHCATFPAEMDGVPGHPEPELAFIELYRETKDPKYLKQAGYYLNRRGEEPRVAGGDEYRQDHKPVREQTTAVGHAVRAMYLYVGAADWYLETGDETILPWMEKLWHDVVDTKTYITGGVGAKHSGEAFGASYELPNESAYSETCAAIGSVIWNRRLLSISGEAKHADVIENALYNNILAAVALDGETFFYVNPLETRGGHKRTLWYACACCPPNIMRTIAEIGGDLFLAYEHTLYVAQYAACEIDTVLPGGKRAHFKIETNYPWDGAVKVSPLEGNECSDVKFRSPGLGKWFGGDSLQANTHHEFTLDMDIKTLVSHPAVTSNRGKVALQRGPLVYCFESIDNPGYSVMALELIPDAPDADAGVRGWKVSGTLDADLGVLRLRGPGQVSTGKPGDTVEESSALYRQFAGTPLMESVTLHAIPYFAWANRGESAMRIWMPSAQ